MVSMSSPLTVVGILVQVYRYRSLVTQITHHAVLAQISYLAKNSFPTENRTSATFRSMISNQHAINNVTNKGGENIIRFISEKKVFWNKFNFFKENIFLRKKYLKYTVKLDMFFLSLSFFKQISFRDYVDFV